MKEELRLWLRAVHRGATLRSSSGWTVTWPFSTWLSRVDDTCLNLSTQLRQDNGTCVTSLKDSQFSSEVKTSRFLNPESGCMAFLQKLWGQTELCERKWQRTWRWRGGLCSELKLVGVSLCWPCGSNFRRKKLWRLASNWTRNLARPERSNPASGQRLMKLSKGSMVFATKICSCLKSNGFKTF